jgi:hypothetical protein
LNNNTSANGDNSNEPLEFANLDDFDFDLLLQDIFIEKQVEYIEALQITGDQFFSTVEQVNVLLESTIGDLQNMEEPPVEEENVVDADGDSAGDQNQGDIISGSPSPTLTPVVESYSADSFFTTPVVIGIAVGGSVLLLTTVFFFWYCCCFRKRSRTLEGDSKTRAPVGGRMSPSDNLDKKVPPGTPKSQPWNRRRNKQNALEGPIDSMAEQHLMSTDMSSNRPDDEASDLASDADLESQAMYSYNPRGDSGSVYTASNSIMMAGGGAVHSNHSYYGNDNMSYAYSLEPGIEASIVDGIMINNMNHSSTYDDSVRSRVPIREIPQISLDAENGASTSGLARTSLTESQTYNTRSPNNIPSDRFGNTRIETTASDLKLTASELAMLPSNLRSDDETEGGGNDVSSSGFPTDKRVTRTIKAPSGKLGIVIDTTVEGPVVHNVNQGSRLQGIIFPGDIIVAIDSVDTRAMSASAITALMVKTASQERTLTVKRVESTT